MKQKWIDAYLDTAERFAQLSSAKRLQVGAVVVKDHRIISIGYNGTPPGWDNTCETRTWIPNEGPGGDSGVYVLTTKPEVIHAEANAIVKLARDGESGKGGTMFCTHAPCIECAKLIHGVGIHRVIFRHLYRDLAGVDLLEKSGVEVVHADPAKLFCDSDEMPVESL